jgi:predicted nucleotidyltransferase component of viral defense system
MSWSETYLDGLSSEAGFRRETLEKILRLGELLDDVTRHPLLSSVLALKGGTALNLCFGAPARLSVDLDFNYIGSADRARMMTERPIVERAVLQIAKGRAYRVQKSRDEHAGRKYFLAYVSPAGTSDRNDIDLNFLQRVHCCPRPDEASGGRMVGKGLLRTR